MAAVHNFMDFGALGDRGDRATSGSAGRRPPSRVKSGMTRDYAITPMTLGNMRANGVRSLLVYCMACPRTVAINVDGYPETVPVPSFGPRMVCTGCGMVGADARPNWRGRRPPSAWR
jgi:hypothetical protein